MVQARPGEDVRSRIGRFVVIAVAGAIAVLMLWALYDAAGRTPDVEGTAPSPWTSATSPAPVATAPLSV